MHKDCHFRYGIFYDSRETGLLFGELGETPPCFETKLIIPDSTQKNNSKNAGLMFVG